MSGPRFDLIRELVEALGHDAANLSEVRVTIKVRDDISLIGDIIVPVEHTAVFRFDGAAS